MSTHRTLVLAALLVAATACGRGSATASLQLRNATGGPGLKRMTPLAQLAGNAAASGFFDATWEAPSVLELKLVAVYLSEDVDPVTQDNVGQTAMIYLNPQCQGDISNCGPADTFAHQVTTFFDFAQGSDAVNAALNAQANAIAPATYRYARMEFCKYGPGADPNLIWQATGLSAPATGQFNACGITSQPFATPLTLKAGDSVRVELAYDLSQAAMTGTAPPDPSTLYDAGGVAHNFMYCADEGTQRTCLQVPDFVPGVVP
jgi:hypothetical protein